MTKKEIIEQLKKEAIRSSYPVKPYGGQNVGVMPKGITLEHADTGFSISINYHRSQLQNLELAYILFELFLEETIKE